MCAKYYKDSEMSFVNPYNFIPNDIEVKRNKIEKGELSGKIECTLKLKTPLIIPQAKPSNAKEEHSYFDFLSLKDKYLIPGSSIRGVLRSNFEVASNSCMVTARGADKLSIRDDSRKPKDPGVLIWEKDEPCLYTAKRYLIPIDSKSGKNFKVNYAEGKVDKYKTGDLVSFIYYEKKDKYIVKEIIKKVDDEFAYTGDNNKIGYILVGENFSNKKYCSVFVRYTEGNDANKNKINPMICKGEKVRNALNNYIECINIYNDDKINSQKGKDDFYVGMKQMAEDFKNKKINAMPVFYKEEDNKLYLSPGQISRSVLYKDEASLFGSQCTCKDRDEICEACSVFGMIGTSKNSKGVGSRVRVSDAYISKKESEYKKVTLRELASPKPSYMPFYSTGKKGQNFDTNNVKAAGRKFYWHGNTDKRNYKENKRSGTYQYLENEETNFSIYFDNLKEEELADLLWVLCLGENNKDSKYCFKMGHGKPYGYGSVKIVVDKLLIKDDTNGWNIKNEDINSYLQKTNIDINSDRIKNLLMISDFSFENKDIVNYPAIMNNGIPEYQSEKNNLAAHQWFNANEKKLPSIKETHDENKTFKYKK